MEKIDNFVKLYLDWNRSPEKLMKAFQILGFYVPSIALPGFVIYTFLDTMKYRESIEILLGLIFLVIWTFMIVRIGWSRGYKFLDIVRGKKYFVIPAVADWIKFFGECVAVSLFLFPIILLADLINGGYGPTYEYGIFTLIIYPLFGYFLLLFSNFFAESLTALVDIANNTNEMVKKSSK